ncbi:MAG: hypothetical protein SGCHY_005383 [Lobulomycetales sp.]
MSWAPQPEGVQQLIGVLSDFQSHDNRVQRSAVDRLESYSKTVPDYLCYLAFIFSSETAPGSTIYLRNQAGLILKNQLNAWADPASLAPLLAYVRDITLAALKDPQEQIRNVAGTLVTNIYSKGEESWPGLIPTLIALFDDPAGQEVGYIYYLLLQNLLLQGSFGAISKICEDSTNILASNEIINVLGGSFSEQT